MNLAARNAGVTNIPQVSLPERAASIQDEPGGPAQVRAGAFLTFLPALTTNFAGRDPDGRSARGG